MKIMILEERISYLKFHGEKRPNHESRKYPLPGWLSYRNEFWAHFSPADRDGIQETKPIWYMEHKHVSLAIIVALRTHLTLYFIFIA